MPVVWIILQKYWWIILLAAIVIYVFILRTGIESRDKTVEQLKQTIVLKDAELKNASVKIDTQNKAVEDLAQKGKEQAARLDGAIKRVNDMKPATQVIIREIYTDKSKDTNQLLLNALSD